MDKRTARYRILVPRIVDAENRNAQNLNAKAMLARFRAPDMEWHCLHYGAPDEAVTENETVICHRLSRGRVWPWQVVAHYARSYDAVFYPGNGWEDARGIAARRTLRRSGPIIATLEGLQGDKTRETYLSERMGHPVFLQNKPREAVRNFDFVHRSADAMISISSYLGKAGKELFGQEPRVLELGVDINAFPAGAESATGELDVVSAGSLIKGKRPEAFIALAAEFPGLRFRWYGDGGLRDALNRRVEKLGLTNMTFAAAVPPEELAGAFQSASVFIMPSRSEGAPKVCLEAAASGLPVIAFGDYEPPDVRNGETGFVVWSDDELKRRLRELLDNPSLRKSMGAAGRKLAESRDWDIVAPKWLAAIRALIAEKTA